MKRYWPVFLALFCWLLLLLIPAARQSTYGVWSNWRLLNDKERPTFEPLLFSGISITTEALLKQYPNDKAVQIYALTHQNVVQATDPGSTTLQDVDTMAKRHPNDLLVLTFQLRRYAEDTMRLRAYGSSENAVSERFIALIQRAQRLEPENSYFDWMLLYALYDTKQTERARAVLKQAARKKQFNPHNREWNLNDVEIAKRLYGPALPSLAMTSYIKITSYSESRIFKLVVVWLNQVTNNDRAQGQPVRALETSFDLMKLCQTTRRESYSVIDLMNYRQVEQANQTVYGIRNTMTKDEILAAYKKQPRTLYAYARALGRNDIAEADIANLSEVREWIKPAQATDTNWLKRSWLASHFPAIVGLTFIERLRVLLLWTLPLASALCLFFGLLTWRFPVHSVLMPQFRGGAKSGVFLIGLATVCSTAISYIYPKTVAWSNSDPFMLYLSNQGLLSVAPSWIFVGIPLIVLCFGLHQAGQWQGQQRGALLPLKTRLKNLSLPPEDGLARFDFGWAVGFVLRLTYWLIVVAAFVHFCISRDDWWTPNSFEHKHSAPWFMGLAVSISLSALFVAWRNRPHRIEALRLSFRTTFQLLAGYVVAVSLIYALATFATLPVNLRLATDFEKMIDKGEFQLVRIELGL